MSTAQVSSDAEFERDPFCVLSVEAGAGIVVTNAGRFTIDQAAHLLVDRLGRFDWTAWDSRETLPKNECFAICDEFDDLFTIASCVAQINLYQARLLWCLNGSEYVGLPRMLDKSSEKQELEYQYHLRQLRALRDDRVTDYMLTHGAEIFEWERKRDQFVTRVAAKGNEPKLVEEVPLEKGGLWCAEAAPNDALDGPTP